ncbi:MAG: hypothetical protein JWM99_725 [Verrucomicrobiales bacterium]|nr:hypothetical protein [Verrucomicrobiales bacterium]
MITPGSYTNQLSKIWQYTYDPNGHKTKEVAVSVYTNSFSYSPAGDLLTLQDGKSQVTSCLSIQQPSGSFTNGYRYDANSRLTNLTSTAGTFSYDYHSEAGASRLVRRFCCRTAPTSAISTMAPGN